MSETSKEFDQFYKILEEERRDKTMSKQPVNENSTTMCASCDIDLATCDTIWAAKGILYCSHACGVHDYHDAELDFDDVAEEIKPTDIGLL